MPLSDDKLFANRVPTRPKASRSATSPEAPPNVSRSPARQSRSRDRAVMLHVRVPDALKDEAAATLKTIGLTTSEAVRLFLHRVVLEQRLPLDLKVPNAETREAMIEARELASRPGRFETPQAMFDDLEKAG